MDLKIYEIHIIFLYHNWDNVIDIWVLNSLVSSKVNKDMKPKFGTLEFCIIIKEQSVKEVEVFFYSST